MQFGPLGDGRGVVRVGTCVRVDPPFFRYAQVPGLLDRRQNQRRPWSTMLLEFINLVYGQLIIRFCGPACQISSALTG